MASEPPTEQTQHEERQAHIANLDATQREAYGYWGYLLKPDKCGTPVLDRLLKGIAHVIVSMTTVLAQRSASLTLSAEPQVRTE